MKENNTLKILDTLINFFDTGNSLTDSVAKAIFREDGEYEECWSKAIDDFSKSVEWTGIRAPESELLSINLRRIRDLHAGKTQ